MDQLSDYILTCTRHKLIFMSIASLDISFIDIGLELSKAIESQIDKKRISLITDECLEKIIKNNIMHHTIIGEYIAIKNIGILFEPTLKLDLKAKIDSWSKSFILIIDSNEGIIKDNIFYLVGAIGSTYSINLSEISNKTIYNEI